MLILSTSDPVLVLLIPFSAILPQYLPCGYDTVHYYQYQSYWYPTVHLCLSTRPALLILYSPLLPQYQTYWYNTIHYCPSTSPTDTLLSTIIQFPVLLIWLRSQYQSFWYAQSTTAVVPVLLILHNPLLSQYQTYWYNAVSFCLSTSSTDTIQTTTAAVPVLQIWHSPLVSQYQSYWYPTVDPCPSTSTIDTLQSTTAPVPVLLIRQYTTALVPVLHIRYSILLT